MQAGLQALSVQEPGLPALYSKCLQHLGIPPQFLIALESWYFGYHVSLLSSSIASSLLPPLLCPLSLSFLSPSSLDLFSHGPACWPFSVYFFLSLLWILSDVSGHTLPHVYNKNLLLQHTLEQSGPQFIQKGSGATKVLIYVI